MDELEGKTKKKFNNRVWVQNGTRKNLIENKKNVFG